MRGAWRAEDLLKRRARLVTLKQKTPLCCVHAFVFFFWFSREIEIMLHFKRLNIQIFFLLLCTCTEKGIVEKLRFFFVKMVNVACNTHSCICRIYRSRYVVFLLLLCSYKATLHFPDRKVHWGRSSRLSYAYYPIFLSQCSCKFLGVSKLKNAFIQDVQQQQL